MLWTEEQLRAEFHFHNIGIHSTKEINDGLQLTLRGGTIVNLYHSGKTLVQGKSSDPIEKNMVSSICNGLKNMPKIYLFLGIDQNANKELESLLSCSGIPFEASNTNPLLI